MRAASFLFYIIAYTIGVLNLALLWALYSRDREPLYRREFFLMLSFGLNLICRIVQNYLGTPESSDPVAEVIFCVIFLSLALMTWAVPTYIHGFVTNRFAPLLNTFFAIAGVALAIVAIVMQLFLHNGDGGVAAFFFLMAVVVYSIGNGVYAVIRRPRAMRATGAASIALKMGAVTLLLLPLIIASDFYGARIPFLEAIFPGGFYTVSIIFLLWSVLMIAERAPALFRGPSRLPGATLGMNPDPEVLARLRISDRERDVLVLLLQGKSYAEIATTLFISLATVKTHIGHLYRKAGAGSKMELAHIVMTA